MTNPLKLMMAASGSGDDAATPGQVWGAGSNAFGALGDGTSTYRSSPVQFGSLSNWVQVTGYKTTMAINEDGELWVTGMNTHGTLGIGTTGGSVYSSPQQVGSDTDWQVVSQAGKEPSVVAVRGGKLFCWGAGQYGQIGDGTKTTKSSPTQIGTATDWASHIGAVGGSGQSSFAIKEDGSLWSWGKSNRGQLGHDNKTQECSPVQVGYNAGGVLYDWSTVANGKKSEHTIAVKTDGTLWSWGLNNMGQLGHGNLTYLSSPVQVGTLTNWAQATCGGSISAMVKTDGTLWTMGEGGQGALGHGNVTNYCSPVQVGALTDWVKVGMAGYSTTGYKNDGTLWSWGWSRDGCSGRGDTATTSSPAQIGSETTWVDLGASYLRAIKTV